MFVNEIMPKICSKFYCEKCDYKTSKKSSYENHLVSIKHNKTMVVNQIMPKLCSKYVCENCNKIYKDNSGLWRHKQKCINTPINTPITNDTNIINTLVNENKTLKEFMLEQNQDFKALIIELLKKETINNQINNNISNNCNNKSFNMNFFLNEQCKDALNINEFVDSIKMQLSDLEEFAHLGYADGVSNIFVKGINALEVHLRPIHCSDTKREVLYIKNNNEWIKETDDKTLIKSAIRRVAFKNIRQINDWVKENPTCKDPTTKKYDQYNQIVMNAMSGVTEEEQKNNIEKIVRNVTKAVAIDKYALK
jgi:ribosomal protein L37AE/L43A